MEQRNETIEEIINFLSGYLHGKAKAMKLSLITFFPGDTSSSRTCRASERQP
jgi:hypothetical protein